MSTASYSHVTVRRGSLNLASIAAPSSQGSTLLHASMQVTQVLSRRLTFWIVVANSVVNWGTSMLNCIKVLSVSSGWYSFLFVGSLDLGAAAWAMRKGTV